MLELDDIQHILLTRAPALTGRYEFLSFREGAGGRAWLSAIKETVQSAAAMRATVEQRQALGDVSAFTWNGLRALGTGRGFALVISGGISSRACRRALRCSAIPAATPRAIGSAGSQALTCTPS